MLFPGLAERWSSGKAGLRSRRVSDMLPTLEISVFELSPYPNRKNRVENVAVNALQLTDMCN